MSHQLWLWIAFNAFVVAMLVLDQVVFHKKAHAVTIKEAVGWSIFWVALALTFNVGIYFWYAKKSALEFLTGYLIELSLSIDNLFVFLVIFKYFRVPSVYQHKILLWGVIGAQVMRAVFIFLGVTLIAQFHWIIYIFGVFLVITGFKMMFQHSENMHPEDNPAIKFFQKFMPVSERYDANSFFVKKDGRFLATPLLIVLLVIDTVDLMFAVDSIPAVLAITLDPFIVYSSNIFAILGLRAFYFVLAHFMQLFHHLHYGLSVILIFVGVKMLASDFFHIPIGIALGVVVLTLGLSVITSMIWPSRHKEKK